MGIKLFSFLGTGAYEKTTYTYESGEAPFESHEPLQYSTEAIYALISSLPENQGQTLETKLALTEKAKETNYLQNKKYPDQAGLSAQGEALHIESFLIKDGTSERELWENFQILYQHLEDGDTIYLDITHSFRSLPFVFTAILNYAKALKDIEFGGIFYCAFEASYEEEGLLKTPIFDLSPFVTLNDMSFGADVLMKKGDALYFGQALNKVLAPIPSGHGKGQLINVYRRLASLYEKFFHSLNLSDVHSALGHIADILKEYDEIHDLQDQQKGLEVTYPQLMPYFSLVEKTSDLFTPFHPHPKKKKGHDIFADPEIVSQVIANTDRLIDLCLHFELYQQAATLLSENLVSRVVYEAGGHLFLESSRKPATIHMNQIKKLKVKPDFEADQLLPELGDSPYVEALSLLRARVGDVRNAMNHGCFSDQSSVDLKRLEALIKEYRDLVEKFPKIDPQ